MEAMKGAGEEEGYGCHNINIQNTNVHAMFKTRLVRTVDYALAGFTLTLTLESQHTIILRRNGIVVIDCDCCTTTHR